MAKGLKPVFQPSLRAQGKVEPKADKADTPDNLAALLGPNVVPDEVQVTASATPAAVSTTAAVPASPATTATATVNATEPAEAKRARRTQADPVRLVSRKLEKRAVEKIELLQKTHRFPANIVNMLIALQEQLSQQECRNVTETEIVMRGIRELYEREARKIMSGQPNMAGAGQAEG